MTRSRWSLASCWEYITFGDYSRSMPDHSKSTLSSMGKLDQLKAHVTFEQVAAYYGTLLPELQRPRSTSLIPTCRRSISLAVCTKLFPES